jgi:hypothetical protein
MRFAQAQARRFEPASLGAGAPAAAARDPYVAWGQAPVPAAGEALFTPLHQVQPQFPGAPCMPPSPLTHPPPSLACVCADLCCVL